MIKNTGMFTLKKFLDKWGELVPIEEEKDVPFPIKRIYYISNVQEGVRRSAPGSDLCSWLCKNIGKNTV